MIFRLASDSRTEPASADATAAGGAGAAVTTHELNRLVSESHLTPVAARAILAQQVRQEGIADRQARGLDPRLTSGEVAALNDVMGRGYRASDGRDTRHDDQPFYEESGEVIMSEDPALDAEVTTDNASVADARRSTRERERDAALANASRASAAARLADVAQVNAERRGDAQVDMNLRGRARRNGRADAPFLRIV
jgi:hypothetical protein